MFDDGKGKKARCRLERARQHNTRVLILALLNKTGQCLTARQIRTRLPGPRRPQRSIDYHLGVLRANGLVKQCGEPPAFEAR
jgi:repressor of nif and glnA expression